MKSLRRYNINDVYKTKYFLYNYNSSFAKLVKINSCRNKGFELLSDSSNSKKTSKKEIERISLSRTKKNIKEIALCNDFEYFLTFTINGLNCDRFSLKSCQDKLKSILKAYKRKNSIFMYLIITEKHKDGAFHFHGLCKGINDLYFNKYGYLSSYFFDKLGFNSFSKIDDYFKCCNYITKYISKDCIRNESRQIYLCSRGLKRCFRTELDILSDGDIKWDFMNDYCCIKNIQR